MEEQYEKELLDRCIKKGLVPSECVLDGELVYCLVREGKDPCDGCNANCYHAFKSAAFMKEEFQKTTLYGTPV